METRYLIGLLRENKHSRRISNCEGAVATVIKTLRFIVYLEYKPIPEAHSNTLLPRPTVIGMFKYMTFF